METHFGRRARCIPLTAWQQELVLGSLLGDGTLLQTTSGYCFRVHHGVAQSTLVQWKYEQLRDFVRTPPRLCGAACYFRTVTHPEFERWRAAFYSGPKKIVPIEMLEHALTSFALAVWIMDDGAAEGRQTRLNTQSFRSEEVEDLRRLLHCKFGLKTTINFDKGKPRLRFGASSMPRLRAMVLPHMLPELRYKVPIC